MALPQRTARTVALSSLAEAADQESVARLVSLAFGGEMQACRDWLASSGLEHVRIAREPNPGGVAIPSCLMRIPMGVYFGGKSVRMLGIAGVAVAPECRGQGLALAMMRSAMREAAEEGWPLAGLYASTQALYRQVGFEQAGDRCAISLRLPSLGLRERGSPMTTITDADMPEVRACYAEFARRFDGPLDRGEYVWNRIRKLRDKSYEGFATRNQDGRIDGYLFMSQNRKESGKFDIMLSDFVARNAEAYRRLLGFLGDFAMMADTATFHAGPHHPALMMLPQQSFEVKHYEYWMLRVLNARAAVESRGWREGVRGEVELDLTDDLIDANNGRFALRVREGAATLIPGGRGTLRLNIRALAPLLSGLQDTSGLRLAGLVDGSDEDVEAANAIFTKGSPWTGDFY